MYLLSINVQTQFSVYLLGQCLGHCGLGWFMVRGSVMVNRASRVGLVVRVTSGQLSCLYLHTIEYVMHLENQLLTNYNLKDS